MSTLGRRLGTYLLFYAIGLFYGVMVLCRVLWSVLRNGTGILKQQPKEQVPACLDDKSLGVHNFITTKSDMKFHYVASGELGKPLMLCLHGFPEFWYSWRFQLKEFSKNYRVVAIDMRGYGFSDKPKEKSLYNITYLSQDVKDIVEGLGYSSCVLMGHDWGGLVAWSVAHRFPEIVDRLVVHNCPHPKGLSKISWKQFLLFWYIYFYQLPYLPELFIGLKNFAIIKSIFRGRFFGVKNKENMSDEDVEAYMFAMSQPGAATATINYYRNLVGMLVDRDWMKDGQKKITSPTLVVWGDEDPVLKKDLLNGLTSVVDNLKIRYVGGASHWVQQDEPSIVNDFVREFLDE